MLFAPLSDALTDDIVVAVVAWGRFVVAWGRVVVAWGRVVVSIVESCILDKAVFWKKRGKSIGCPRRPSTVQK